MWIQVFVHSGVALGQAVTPHAGELSVGEQRGGFQRLTAHAAHPEGGSAGSASVVAVGGGPSGVLG